jgi:anaerobic dimethyl sulfoxide reductase subunit C (anchor subunit)
MPTERKKKRQKSQTERKSEMPQNAWSLLVFTLLSQMSVGVFCVAELINFSYTKEFGHEEFHPLRLISRLFVLAAIILAGVSSIFHLKNWAHANFAFYNLKTSWISKEMMFFFLFISCVALLTFMSWRKIKASHLQGFISIVGIFFGIALIFSMIRIYMLPTIPVWDTWTTPGFFSTATLLLGSLSVLCLYTAIFTSSKSSSLMDSSRQRWSQKTLPNLVKLSFIFIVSGIFVTGFFTYNSIVLSDKYSIETSAMSPDKQVVFFLRILFYVLGWVFLLLFIKKLRLKKEIQGSSCKLFYAAFIFITIAEILGRHLFFVSFHRIGL